MSKAKRRILTLFATVACALVCAVTATTLLVPKTSAKADTVSGAATVDLGNSTSGITSSQATALKNLFGYISSGATTYDALSTALGTTKGAVTKSYSDINSGKGVTVTLGGLSWNVVAASKNQSGEVVVTLWLAANSTTTTYSHSSFSSFAEGNTYAPSEYGRSLIRSKLVGSAYATSTSATSTGSADSTWSTLTTRYGKYFDSPYDVSGTSGYQYTQRLNTSNATESTYKWLLPNESYNTSIDSSTTPSTSSGATTWYSTTIRSIQKTTGYDDWKTDKIWLPSLSETGCSASYTGLWKITSNSVRANTSANTYTWLRSAA